MGEFRCGSFSLEKLQLALALGREAAVLSQRVRVFILALGFVFRLGVHILLLVCSLP